MFSGWTWSTRIAGSLIALSTATDAVMLPAKIGMYHRLQAETIDRMTRRLYGGMIAVVIGEDIALLAMLGWSGFRLW